MGAVKDLVVLVHKKLIEQKKLGENFGLRKLLGFVKTVFYFLYLLLLFFNKFYNF